MGSGRDGDGFGRLAPLVPGCEGQGDRNKRANGDGEAPGSSDEVFGHLMGSDLMIRLGPPLLNEVDHETRLDPARNNRPFRTGTHPPWVPTDAPDPSKPPDRDNRTTVGVDSDGYPDRGYPRPSEVRTMRPTRVVFVASIAVMCAVALTACATANPGWTYEPAPSVTPPPSVEVSAEPSASGDSGAIQISAVGLAFEQAEVNVPAGEAFQIEFTNNDPATPHNIAIHRDTATGEEVFKGAIFDGVATQTYDVPALDAGAYAFICTVHPTMVGTLTAG